MKIFISADIEGVSGITHWNEANKSHKDYPEFQKIMNQEVRTVCEVCNRHSASEIWIKDAHGSGRNLSHKEFPENTTLISGWAGNPMAMIQELDESFAALILLGYHSEAGSAENPLSHTMSGRFQRVTINGQACSEFYLHSLMASTLGVPTLLVSGDQGLAEHIREINPSIDMVITKFGRGDSTVSKHPEKVLKELEQAMDQALKSDFKKGLLPLADSYEIHLEFKNFVHAYSASFYPGAKKISDTVVSYKHHDYYEILRAFYFMQRSTF